MRPQRPRAEDVLRVQVQREERIQNYTSDLRHLTARFLQLDGTRRLLLQQINDLEQRGELGDILAWRFCLLSGKLRPSWLPHSSSAFQPKKVMSKEEFPINPGPISLLQWRVMEVVAPGGARSRHVWGHNIANSQGRASTAIVAFDSSTMTATTASGRLYVLVDEPGDSPSGKAAWGKWRSEHKIASESDVSSEYLRTLDQQADTTITFTKLRRGVYLGDGQ